MNGCGQDSAGMDLRLTGFKAHHPVAEGEGVVLADKGRGGHIGVKIKNHAARITVFTIWPKPVLDERRVFD